jgi:uroporphyrinogen-III synthase
MKRPLEGQTVAMAEGRQWQDLASLLAQEGAQPLAYPLLAILDAPDSAPVERWLDSLISGRFALTVLMTGEAVRRLAGFAERGGRLQEYIDALRACPTLTRGPKPGQALRELGLSPAHVAPAPTTEGVLQALRGMDLRGKEVGYTLYGAENPALDQYLREAGAVPHGVLSYVHAPASDDAQVLELVGRLAGRGVDWIVFTSKPQVDRLYEVAERHSVLPILQAGMGRVRVAAVGPVVAESLQEHGVQVDVCPAQGWQMKNLVRHMARAAEEMTSDGPGTTI